METVVTEAFQWLMKDGLPVWLAILGLMLVLVIHAWLIKADPAGIIRNLLNMRKRQLENMLTQEFLSSETRALIERELRQRSLWKLTGVFEHRLQDAAVLFIARYNVRAAYLSKWRSWLSECEGQICFNRTWYWICYWLFWLSTAINTTIWGTIVYLVGRKLGTDHVAPALIICAVPWFMWLLFTLIPTRAMTREMELHLQEFNRASQA